MHGATARIGGGFLALAAIWIGVYWFWEPGRPDVTFSSEPRETAPDPRESPQAEPAPTPQPPTPPPEASGQPEGEATDQTGAQPPAETGGVIPPEFRDYTVRRGDSFSAISRRVYGTTRHAGAIAAANPFVSPSNLREGQVLRVPVDPENVQGTPAEGEPDAIPEPQFIEYVVVKGDTLSEIAQRFYGSLRYAEVIYNANRDVMSSIDDLQIGDVLQIPSPESVLGGGDR